MKGTVWPPVSLSPRRDRRGYAAALRGDIPAEALSPTGRETLVWELWEAEWTDAQIAVHTRMSTYTTARIRARLGLEAR